MSDLLRRLHTDVLWHRRRGNETIARDCQEAADEIERLRKENDFLHAYTGNSALSCVYCGLGADEQGKCERGFPGCARADDQMLCREAAVGLERDQLTAELASARQDAARMRKAIEFAAHKLEGGRIWGGMAWTMNPLHPVHYQPALERLRAAIGEKA